MIYNDNLIINNQKLSEILNLINQMPDLGYRVDDFIIKDNNSIQSIRSMVNSARPYMCCEMFELISVDFPNLLRIPEGAFLSCNKLISTSFPKTTHIAYGAFRRTTSLKQIFLPKLESVQPKSFEYSGVEKITTNHLRHIYAEAFSGAAFLTSLIINRDSIVLEFDNINAFSNTPIAAGTGYIYVPKALIEQYKVAPNWSTYANQFRAIEDYPDICN